MLQRRSILLPILSLLAGLATITLWTWTNSGARPDDPPGGWEYLYSLGFRWRIVGVAWGGHPIYATNAPVRCYFGTIVLSAIPPVASVWFAYRRHRRRSRGLCPHCGYDLRATPESCPECGTSV